MKLSVIVFEDERYVASVGKNVKLFGNSSRLKTTMKSTIDLCDSQSWKHTPY